MEYSYVHKNAPYGVFLTRLPQIDFVPANKLCNLLVSVRLCAICLFISRVRSFVSSSCNAHHFVLFLHSLLFSWHYLIISLFRVSVRPCVILFIYILFVCSHLCLFVRSFIYSLCHCGIHAHGSDKEVE